MLKEGTKVGTNIVVDDYAHRSEIKQQSIVHRKYSISNEDYCNIPTTHIRTAKFLNEFAESCR